jgi:hypothetical protein
MKWKVGKVTSWLNGKLTKLQIDKTVDEMQVVEMAI